MVFRPDDWPRPAGSRVPNIGPEGAKRKMAGTCVLSAEPGRAANGRGHDSNWRAEKRPGDDVAKE